MKQSAIYTKYENTAWSSVSLSTLQTDLDAILDTSIESLPLIRYLVALQKAKVQEQAIDTTDYGVWEKQVLRALYTQIGTSASTSDSTPITISGFFVDPVEHTLSSGALANAPLYQPGAGKKAWVLWCQPGCNLAAMAAQNYLFKFEDEDANQKYAANWLGSEYARYELVEFITTANKDFQVDISGGSAAEHIFWTVAAGYST